MVQKDNDLKPYTKATQVFGHLISIQQSIFLVTEEKTQAATERLTAKHLNQFYTYYI